ncbi:MAG TPA: helicase-associated domain-containing protein, partial [Nocardioidaceae bacterium]|nr:helicase-associated domain-containing protein [Nocardioidaceae bacterium]
MGSNQVKAAPRTLADVVRGWEDARVRDLLRRRPDLATPTPVDTSQLTSRACTRASVNRVLDRVDRLTLAVVEALAALPEPATPAQVAALTAAPQTLVDEALCRLSDLALVWGTDDALRLVRAVHEVIGPHPAGLGPRLGKALAGHRLARVRRLAEDVGVDSGGDKAQICERLGRHLSDPAALTALIEAAGADAAAVLDRLTWGPPTGRLEGASRSVDMGTASSPVERLLARGLLVAVDTSTVVLPREVGLHLRGQRLTREPVHEAPALQGQVRDPDLVDRAAAGAAFEFVRRLEVLLEHWGAHPPGVLRGGGVSVRDLRAAATLLGVDSATAALHIEVAREAGLLGDTDDEDDQVWLPTDAFDAWVTRSFAHRWLVLAQAWLSTQRAIGLVGRRDDRDRLVNALASDIERPLAPSVRRLTLEVLGAAEPGQGCTPDSVVARVAWLRPRRGALRDDLVRWSLDEAAVVGCVGLGALSRHGAALLAGETDDADGGPVDRAEVDAAVLLAPLLPPTVDHVLVQADLTAVAPGPLETELAHDLALCAEVESRGGATVYRFTEASVRHALDSGWTASDVHEFVAARSRTPIPQPLTYLIDDVARRHGQLRVGVAETYLRCDDEPLVREILADPAAASLRLRRVAPTVLVTDMPLDLVLSRLRESGRAPVAESPDGSVAATGLTHRRTRPPRGRHRPQDGCVGASARWRPPNRPATRRPAPARTRAASTAPGRAACRSRA